MRYQILAAVASAAFLIAALSVPAAHGDSFQDFPIRLKHAPVICANEPQKDPALPNLSKEMFDETTYAVMDWKNKLNTGYGKHPAWNMTLVEVPLSRQAAFDYAACDITINYLPKPDTSSLGVVATGVTIPNFETGKTRIEIYYSNVEVGSKMITWTDGNQVFYYYVDVPVYTGGIETEPQLAGIIRHEIGHALGLGHYLVSAPVLHGIVTGTIDMPSIMIDTTTVLGVHHYDITPIDVAEIKSIYGPNGFNGGLASQDFNRTALLAVDQPTYLPNATVGFSVNTSGFSPHDIGTLIAVDPDGRMIGNAVVTKDNSTFSMKADNKTGLYYIEFIDTNRDLYDYASFTVSGGQGIPAWIKHNAKWWSEGSVSDGEFIKGIQYLIQNGIMKVPQTLPESGAPQQIPVWVKKNAGWWADGQISDDEFLKGIQYMVSTGVIKAR